jgi:hypothetical protein
MKKIVSKLRLSKEALHHITGGVVTVSGADFCTGGCPNSVTECTFRGVCKAPTLPRCSTGGYTFC